MDGFGSSNIPKWDDDNIPVNVKSVNNYYVPDDNSFGTNPGEEKIEIDNPSKTKGKNIAKPESDHRSIDQDMQHEVSKEIQDKIKSLDSKKPKN